jgi:4-oxalocrotonate tautomerase
MSLITVRLIENVFSAEQKQQTARDLTERWSLSEASDMPGVTCCVIDEVNRGDWAIGGQPLTTEAVHALGPRRASGHLRAASRKVAIFMTGIPREPLPCARRTRCKNGISHASQQS